MAGGMTCIRRRTAVGQIGRVPVAKVRILAKLAGGVTRHGLLKALKSKVGFTGGHNTVVPLEGERP